MNHQRYAQRFLVMGPLAGKPSLPQVVTIITGVNENRIVCQPRRLQLFHHTTHHVIDSTDHAVVATDVLLVLFVCIPAPEVALAIQTSLEKLWLRLKDLRGRHSRRRDRGILVEMRNNFRERIVILLVAVFCMGSVKTDRQAKRFVLDLLREKLDGPVTGNLTDMAS